MILSQPFSKPIHGRRSGLRECLLHDPADPYVYWNVAFPEEAFDWYETRQYDPDTNRFTDKVIATSRD